MIESKKNDIKKTVSNFVVRRLLSNKTNLTNQIYLYGNAFIAAFIWASVHTVVSAKVKL